MCALPFPPDAPPPGAGLAVQAWNLMGGLDWNALPVVAEMLGIDDVDALIRDLITIRNFQNKD